MNRSGILGAKIERLKKELGNNATLVAVSKYHPASDIIAAYEAGHRDFGESRVQELKEKSEKLKDEGIDDICWHFIGHLQTNKVNHLLRIQNLRFIHSIDSMKLLMELYRKKEYFEGEDLGYFLQVKTSDAEEKYGFQGIDSLREALNFIVEQPKGGPYLHGLMTMGKIRTDDFEGDARAAFKKLVCIKQELLRDYSTFDLALSMGVSQDYKKAVSEGSDFVRVGGAIFGQD